MIRLFVTPAKWLLFTVALLGVAALACNAPLREGNGFEPPPLPPTAVLSTPEQPNGEREATPELAPETIPAIIITETAVTSTPAPLPTFTPITQPTLAATPTPPVGATPAATVTSGVAATPTSTPTPGVQGPLSFTYQINWRFAPDNPFLVIATVAIQAKGGNGVYTYYHDDIQQAGPTFEFNWAACRSKPGSVRVDSGDGQSVRENYFQEPPCPTPTPPP